VQLSNGNKSAGPMMALSGLSIGVGILILYLNDRGAIYDGYGQLHLQRVNPAYKYAANYQYLPYTNSMGLNSVNSMNSLNSSSDLLKYRPE
jgi:hypothetical protein